jgi:hypothetical protein
MKKILLSIALISLIAAGCNEQPAPQINLQQTQTTEPISPQPQQTSPPIQKFNPPALKKTNSNCDPNYSGCVPIASDVDCAGGSGNGPAYVSGPITVIGNDIYGLDRDHDGIACE